MEDNNLLEIYSHFDNLSKDDYQLLSKRAQKYLKSQALLAGKLEDYQVSLAESVLEDLAIKTDINKITHFTFREFENFLRDQNDQEAFGAHLKEEFTIVFNQLRLLSIADILLKSLQNNDSLMSELADMAHDFSLVAKNRYGLIILKALELSLVFANENEIVIAGSRIGLSSSELETILHNVFRSFPKLKDLKVVAV